ncbi:M23 family metallopeptidase [Aureimonas ureilytica]|uniref:M23 family metallopeptidase n=1 Tax=Aureimonas ureilytica TaxID=401562 RepID=UPI003CFBBCEF
MASGSRRSVFGRKSASHTIVIARSDKIRHWTVRPWLLATSLGLAGLTLAGSLGLAGAYLFNDNIVTALLAREVRMANTYEERMANLRNEIDRLKTGQAKVRDTVAAQVQHLLSQQAELTGRFEQLQPLLEKAQAMGVMSAGDKAATDTALKAFIAPSPVSHSSPKPDATALDDISALPLRHADVTEIADLVLPTIRRSVSMVSDEQSSTVAELTRTAQARVDRLADVLGSIGIRTEDATKAMGGPFIPADGDLSFKESLNLLDQALRAYDQLRAKSAGVPLADPLPGATVSSVFGVRPDPFFQRPALHSGVDLAAPTGTLVRSTAAGKVVSAGEAGGYGNMIEIQHANGFSTRYAHLSQIDVAVGERIKAGQAIGRVGSTGRSTGSHLHYEVRTNEAPVDPERYIRVGRKLAKL